MLDPRPFTIEICEQGDFHEVVVSSGTGRDDAVGLPWCLRWGCEYIPESRIQVLRFPDQFSSSFAPNGPLLRAPAVFVGRVVGTKAMSATGAVHPAHGPLSDSGGFAWETGAF